MFIELHLLQNFAPSNLNRDDTGAPKECEFGGYRRARISSQSLKRAIRTVFKDEKLVPQAHLASRTKRLVEDISKRLEREAKRTASAAVPTAVRDTVRRALDGGRAVDLALFGRMLADLPERNVDAAAQVAHAISTNRVSLEFDFYTAVDDLKPDDTAGAD